MTTLWSGERKLVMLVINDQIVQLMATCCDMTGPHSEHKVS